MLGEDSNTYSHLNRSEVTFKVNYFYHKISQTTDVMDVFSIQSIFVKVNFSWVDVDNYDIFCSFENT